MDVWRFFLTELGELFVMILLMIMMALLCVDSWGCLDTNHFSRKGEELVKSFSMISHAGETRRTSRSVDIKDTLATIAVIAKMSG